MPPDGVRSAAQVPAVRAVRRGVAEAREPRVHVAERSADSGPQVRRL